MQEFKCLPQIGSLDGLANGKGMIAKMMINVGVVLLVIALVFCCVFPFIRELCTRATIRQMAITILTGQYNTDEGDDLYIAVRTEEVKTYGLMPKKEKSPGKY